MATGTTNPAGSNDPRDLRANAENLDLLITGPELNYPDRLGVSRRSWAGIDASYQAAEAQREAAFQEQLANTGYDLPSIPYAAGILIERETQLIERMGEFYRAKPGVVPFTTTGTWATDELNLVAVGDAALRTELAGDSGATLVSYKSLLANAISRSLDIELRELAVPITRLGATPGVDCTQAIISALTLTDGVIFIPAGAFLANVGISDSEQLLSCLNRIRLDGTLTINLAAGKHQHNTQTRVNSADANRIQLLGAPTVQTAITGLISVTGSAKAYSVTFSLTSTAGMAVGDYVIIREDISGSDNVDDHPGCWEITAIAGSNVTLLNTHHAATFPVNSVTGGTIVCVKTQINYAACDGIRFEGAQGLGALNRIALTGDWNLAAATGTTGCHGVVMATPLITPGNSSNATFNMAGFALMGSSMGVAKFGEQGVIISGRSGLVWNFHAVSSCRKKGVYAEGGHGRMKFGVSTGHGEESYISDTSGFLQLANSVGGGCGLGTMLCINNGTITAAGFRSSRPLGNAAECRGVGHLAASGLKSYMPGISHLVSSEGGSGVYADGAIMIGGVHGASSSAGFIRAENSTITGVSQYGARALDGAFVRMNGSTITGSGVDDYFSTGGGTLYRADGSVDVNNTPIYGVGARVYAGNKTSYVSLSASTIGDFTVTPGGTTSRLVVQSAAGQVRPSVTRTQSLGTTTFEWGTVNAVNGAFSGPLATGQYTLATLPSASAFSGYLITVTDATGGPKVCRSNGSVWQILNTTTTVS